MNITLMPQAGRAIKVDGTILFAPEGQVKTTLLGYFMKAEPEFSTEVERLASMIKDDDDFCKVVGHIHDLYKGGWIK